jgi:hypothetical protein
MQCTGQCGESSHFQPGWYINQPHALTWRSAPYAVLHKKVVARGSATGSTVDHTSQSLKSITLPIQVSSNRVEISARFDPAVSTLIAGCFIRSPSSWGRRISGRRCSLKQRSKALKAPPQSWSVGVLFCKKWLCASSQPEISSFGTQLGRLIS